MFLSELPGGWTREFDPDGKVVYYNTMTNRATHRHPCLYQYRALFAKLVQTEENRPEYSVVVDKRTKNWLKEARRKREEREEEARERKTIS